MRNGTARPSSPPTAQLVVLNAVPVALATDQFAWVMLPASFTSGVTDHCTAPPRVVGSSFCAFWKPLTTARRWLYDCRNAVTRTPDAGAARTLSETPNPS